MAQRESEKREGAKQVSQSLETLATNYKFTLPTDISTVIMNIRKKMTSILVVNKRTKTNE